MVPRIVFESYFSYGWAALFQLVENWTLIW